jgi:hypothetical protein
MLVEEAVLAHVAALDAKAERDAAAWQDAETASAEALRSARGR